jgi:hypothetical protein
MESSSISLIPSSEGFDDGMITSSHLDFNGRLHSHFDPLTLLPIQ